jgi:hypothetical protein
MVVEALSWSEPMARVAFILYSRYIEETLVKRED